MFDYIGKKLFNSKFDYYDDLPKIRLENKTNEQKNNKNNKNCLIY